jgi:Flp pilus assembly pilin Flp
MTPRRPLIRAALRERSGVTSLEWALVAGAFMLMIISIIDLVRYVAGVQSVASITAQAGRACLVNAGLCPFSGTGSEIWSNTPVIAPILDSGDFTVSIINSHSNSAYPNDPFSGSNASLGVNVIYVTVNYQFTAWAPWLSMLNGTVTESATYFN